MTSALSPGQALCAGAWRCAPVAAGAVPFGMAFGLAASDHGVSVLGALGMSVVMFAGAAQLATLELTGSGTPVLLVIAVALLINLRFAMYGAAISPYLRGPGRLARAGLSYLLTDQAFAVSVAAYEEEGPRRQPVWFYAGAAALLWVAWQVGTVLGASLGAIDLSTELAPALVFVALGIFALKDRVDALVAGSALVTFFALAWLPYGMALLPAAVVGLAAGRVVDRMRLARAAS